MNIQNAALSKYIQRDNARKDMVLVCHELQLCVGLVLLFLEILFLEKNSKQTGQLTVLLLRNMKTVTTFSRQTFTLLVSFHMCFQDIFVLKAFVTNITLFSRIHSNYCGL